MEGMISIDMIVKYKDDIEQQEPNDDNSTNHTEKRKEYHAFDLIYNILLLSKEIELLKEEQYHNNIMDLPYE